MLSESKTRMWVWLLCAAAAVRVFVFAAAFPLFNNVDEQQHFDLVVKYSHGQIPRGLDLISAESAHYIVLYGSPEYLFKPERFGARGYPPPLWQWPAERAKSIYDTGMSHWQAETNHEASGAPLYYAMAGAWLRLGQGVGLADEGGLPYWIRFLNVFVAAALVWLGFVAARMIFPERRWLWLGVPLLLAFFPQDMFYSIQSDVLSPLCFGLGFVFLVKWLRAEAPGAGLSVATGLVLAGAGLVKTSNLPLLAVSAAVVLFHCFHRARNGTLRAALPAAGLLALGVALPIGSWLVWNQSVFGDLTGSAAKIRHLGWAHKPFGDWWSHPVFRPHGAWTFGSELMASFWRGEFVWSGLRLAWSGLDGLYWVSSALFLGLALAGLLRKSAGTNRSQWQALWFAFLSFVAVVVFLGCISIAFDFGNCFYPSRLHPYLTSGRLLSGALIPFALLYVYGLDRALGRTKSERPRLPVLAGIVFVVAVSEIIINSVAFSSRYNWFHM